MTSLVFLGQLGDFTSLVNARTTRDFISALSRFCD